MSHTVRSPRQSKLASYSVKLLSCLFRTRSQAILRNTPFCRGVATTASCANLSTNTADGDTTPPQLLLLPKTCPGCGAYRQKLNPKGPGFFSISRRAVKSLLKHEASGAGNAIDQESEAFHKVLKYADQSTLDILGLRAQDTVVKEPQNGEESANSEVSLEMAPARVCDRCHDLRHHNAGASIIHPTLEYIRRIISESTFNHNHIYHVIDAADFPLSLIPSLQQSLSLSPQRSLNRRSKTAHYHEGFTSEMSYIITRSDLLVPKKEQADKIMPYIVEVLRDALGGSARNMRLGNVHCVSSKRGWWTKNLKEDIYQRGGGGWMVGKVNVGKSSLFENVFPKGRTLDLASDPLHGKAPSTHQPALNTSKILPVTGPSKDGEGLLEPSKEVRRISNNPDSSLPPISKETPFPLMPLVSSLPGTTASPIRLSFGNRKGELIDLPGLHRGGLEYFVVDGHKHDLVMQNRTKAKQLAIKPGQSLLVDGLIQITPVTPDITFLAYPFLPLKCHVTSVEKARSIIMGDGVAGFSTIARPGLGSRMQTAGKYALKWDVTKARAGPLTAKAAARLHTKELPFVVLSTDVLIEGCGWIELVAQVRRRTFSNSEVAQTKSFFDDRDYPMVEIKSPDGKHIGYRRPMGAWLLGGERQRTSGRLDRRPRRSMKGAKKRLRTVG